MTFVDEVERRVAEYIGLSAHTVTGKSLSARISRLRLNEIMDGPDSLFGRVVAEYRSALLAGASEARALRDAKCEYEIGLRRIDEQFARAVGIALQPSPPPYEFPSDPEERRVCNHIGATYEYIDARAYEPPRTTIERFRRNRLNEILADAIPSALSAYSSAPPEAAFARARRVYDERMAVINDFYPREKIRN